MRTLIAIAMVGSGVLLVTFAGAQPPGRPDRGRNENAPPADASGFVTRMMTFDTNQDGKLSKDELTDSRLVSLFERADKNMDGVVTKEELTAEFNKESANLGAGGFGGGPGGPGGPGGGGPGRRGFGGPGGPGGPGMGGPPPIGQILPPHIQEMLGLSNAQRKKIDALQRHVDNKLGEILTEDQKQRLEEMKNRGPRGPDGDRGGFGPPQGGGPGGPGGNRPRDGGPGGPPGESGRPQRPAGDEPRPNE